MYLEEDGALLRVTLLVMLALFLGAAGMSGRSLARPAGSPNRF